MKSTNLVLTALALTAVLGVAVYYYEFDRPQPNASTVVAWEQNFRTVLPPDYRDFQGHWVEIDSSSYIFSYASKVLLQDLPTVLNRYEPRFKQVMYKDDYLYMTSDIGSWTVRRNQPTGRLYVLFARRRTDDEVPKYSFQRLREISG